MSRQIQIANLPGSVNDVALRQMFEAYGAVRSATINSHFGTGRSTGVGFVEMASEEDGANAIAALNHRECFGQILSACWCNSAMNAETASTATRSVRGDHLRHQANERYRQWEF